VFVGEVKHKRNAWHPSIHPRSGGSQQTTAAGTLGSSRARPLTPANPVNSPCAACVPSPCPALRRLHGSPPAPWLRCPGAAEPAPFAAPCAGDRRGGRRASPTASSVYRGGALRVLARGARGMPCWCGHSARWAGAHSRGRPGPSATDARARALPMLRARKCNAHARPRVGPVRAAPAHACAQPWPRTALGAAFAGMRQGAVPKSGRSSVTACACTWAACVSMCICARVRVHVRALHVHAWKIASRHPAFRRVCE
jgi:hypothetical protein